MGFIKSFSDATVVGNLAADPKVYTTKGERSQKIASFTICVNEIYRGGSKYANWIEVTAWAGLAELAEKYLVKGSKALVGGAIKTRVWEDNEGNKRKNTYIQAKHIVLLDYKKETGEKRSESEEEAPPPEDEEVPF